MMNYQTKLRKQYNKIMNICNEINDSSNINESNLKTLEKLLNNCIPKNTEEKTIYYFVKDLYYIDKENFLKYISNTENIHLMLITDNKSMMNHFNLNEKVFIGWNNEYKKYFVSKYVKKELIINEKYVDDNLNDIIYDMVDAITL
jgi:hypothetical protein